MPRDDDVPGPGSLTDPSHPDPIEVRQESTVGRILGFSDAILGAPRAQIEVIRPRGRHVMVTGDGSEATMRAAMPDPGKHLAGQLRPYPAASAAARDVR